MISRRESLTISYSKAFAILSVVCAHISLVPETFSQKSQIVCMLINEIGAIGVGLFYIMSGYLFKRKGVGVSFFDFIKRKFNTIVIPWVIAATLVYMYVAIRKGGSFVEGVLSVLGYKSSFWYLAVLMVLYMWFYLIAISKNESIGIGISIILSGVSVALRAINIIPPSICGIYLNVFNWMVFFLIGYLGAVYAERIAKFISSYITIVFSLILSVIIILLPCFFDIGRFSYFALWYIPTELIICAFIIGVSYRLSILKQINLLGLLGNLSFSIYLYHELLWAGLIVHILNRFDSIFCIIIRPFIVIACVVGELYLGKLLFGLFNKTDFYYKLVGARIK